MKMKMKHGYKSLYVKLAICLPLSCTLANHDGVPWYPSTSTVADFSTSKPTNDIASENDYFGSSNRPSSNDCPNASDSATTASSRKMPRRLWGDDWKQTSANNNQNEIPAATTIKYSSSRKASTTSSPTSSTTTTILDPSKYYYSGNANDVDSDFDPDFIPRKLLDDQDAHNNDNIPISTTKRTWASSSSSSSEPELPPMPGSKAGDGTITSVGDHDNNIQQQQLQQQRLPHSPVIFRYYGKRRSRTRASGSIPFILLGPNIDHWRTTGEHLAARGFSVIACERDLLEPTDEDENDNEIAKDGPRAVVPGATGSGDWGVDDWWQGTDGEGENLILNVLQASRWSKAILVACDSEAVIAIQAVMRLAPDKIAGLVLCGDLKEVDALLLKSHPHLSQEGDFAIDVFLSQLLPCPFAIAWDGKTSSDKPPLPTPSEYDASTPAECLHGNRCLILGGGIAPHRRQPETFSWTLTRFVEDKVAEKGRRVKREPITKESDVVVGPHLPIPKALKNMFSNSFFSGDFFSTGSWVVYGRIIASVLLYASALKVGIYQYGNFLDRMVNMKTRYDGVRRFKQQVIGAITGFFVNFGYIHLLFARSEETETEIDLADFPAGLGQQEDLDHQDDGLSPQAEDTSEEIAEQETQTSDVEATENETKGDGMVEDESPREELEEPKQEEEPEERRIFQPLFFLDRVIADSASAGSDERRA